MKLFTKKKSNKVILLLFITFVVFSVLFGCASISKTGNAAQTATVSAEVAQNDDANSIDYLVLVNKQNVLPEGWEESLEIVNVTNSLGDPVEVEKKS